MAPRSERSLKHQQYAIGYKNVFSIKRNQTWDNELSWVSTEGSDHAQQVKISLLKRCGDE